MGKVNIHSTQEGRYLTDQSATMRIHAPEEDGAAGKDWMTIEQSKDTGKVILSRRLKNVFLGGRAHADPHPPAPPYIAQRQQ